MVINLNKKDKLKCTIIYIIFFISLIGIAFSLYKIINYKLDQNKIYNQLNIIKENIIITNVIEEDNNIEIIEPEPNIPESNPYWDYINMNLIDVDFSELKSINDSVKGWIQVNGTNINYPFVQALDNKYYLTHSFDKNYNSAGWVFLDYRNDLSNFNDKNTIIYAHGRYDNTMFGSLRNILSSEWITNTNNYIVKLSTEYENTLWQVFSIYRIPTTSDYIRTTFKDDNDYLEFINMLINRSAYNFNTSVSESDRILTLSTCYNDYDKVVLHAKLIKRETK